MDEQQAGHFLTKLGSALNPEEEYRIRQPEDYVMEMPQSGERFRGAGELQYNVAQAGRPRRRRGEVRGLPHQTSRP